MYQWDNITGKRRMRKSLFILVSLFICASAFAERYSFGNGITLITYGNTAVIEDDNTQQSISLSIEKREDSYGQSVYDILCGNQYTKGVTKQLIKDVLSVAIPAATEAIGTSSTFGAASGVGASIGVAITPYINSIVSNIYDDACEYFGDR